METVKIMTACEKMIALRRANLRRAFLRNGLHLGQPEMLSFVQMNPGCSQREMAADAGVTPASIAASFKRMENAGLIFRRSDTADLRCNRVYITPRGEAELGQCLCAMERINDDMLTGLSEEELRVFLRCLEQMNENLGEMMKK